MDTKQKGRVCTLLAAAALLLDDSIYIGYDLSTAARTVSGFMGRRLTLAPVAS